MSESQLVFNRLDRIENKVDSLVEVTTKLATIEERSSNQNQNIQFIRKELNEHDTRITRLESGNTRVFTGTKLIAWIVVTAISLTGVVVAAVQLGPK